MLYFQIKTIEAEWHKYASVNQTITGSDKDVSSARRQAIMEANPGF